MWYRSVGYSPTLGLRKRNIDMVFIFGDHEKPTKKLAEAVGIDHYFAETLPQNKAVLIEQLQAQGQEVLYFLTVDILTETSADQLMATSQEDATYLTVLAERFKACLAKV